MDDADRTGRTTLRVISGNATPEELAAVLAVVTVRGRVVAAERTEPATASVWAGARHAHRAVRPRWQVGVHGWRTSYWPR